MSAGAPTERREAVAKLAQTYMSGGQRHRAVAALERALGEDPKAVSLWNILASLHREAAHFTPVISFAFFRRKRGHSNDRTTCQAPPQERL